MTGSSLEALLAGSKPKITPDINATINETYEAHNGGRKLNVGKDIFNTCVILCPKIKPKIAPEPDSKIASVINS